MNRNHLPPKAKKKKNVQGQISYYECMGYKAKESGDHADMHYNFQIADHFKRVHKGVA